MTTTPDAPVRKKLIEVSIPLEDINAESAREKSIRHGHPSTLHLWWARRPLAAARAVLFAQLVDDPSSDPSLSEEEQKFERERLHNLIRRLVKWENVNNAALLREAHEEIRKSTGGNPPTILDPFAGGGTIPLEAQRLGLEAHASDLNPVAVLINKALIEIPPRFAGQPPVFPGAADTKLGDWPGATGLAEDVRRYGGWMRDQARKRIGHLYPDALLVDEKTGRPLIDPKTGEQQTATTIAWIWARTITCPNPACGIEMPLVRSWWLGRKKGKEAYIVPTVVEDARVPAGRRIAFAVSHDTAKGPSASSDGTVGRQGAHCIACGTPVELNYIRREGKAKRIGATLMAVVADSRPGRTYLNPTTDLETSSIVPRPADSPGGALPANPRDFKTPNYGLTHWADLFTNRQLIALSTLSDLVDDARERILSDALAAGAIQGNRLEEDGADAAAYADAVATYLGLGVSKLADMNNSLARWKQSMDQAIALFSRQAIPMVWDYAETNPFAEAAGDLVVSIGGMARVIDKLPASGPALARQEDAASRDYQNVVIATDPPYYDNIGYSDLSDFFYVWLRRALRRTHPALFTTVLVPKAEELVANPYRHGGRTGAEEFFESGLEKVFTRARVNASDEFPITVYYAFKQQELEKEGTTSTGWATLLEGIIRSGWTITATWPVRSEMGNRMIASGTNALASSIVLSLRPRKDSAVATSRRGFLSALHQELPQALYEMQQGSIAPVDLAQSTVGPGMAIFSRYSQVIENDGKPMTVKSALALINEVLDHVLAEKEGDFDPDTRFCLKWYQQYGWNKAPYGEADVLARAVDTSVAGLKDAGVLASREGTVQLTRPVDLPQTWNPVTDDRISIWEVTCHLARTLIAESGGIEPAARLMAMAATRVDLEAVQLLSYRLYELTQNSRPDDAQMFNALGSTWADLSAAAGTVDLTVARQGDLDLGLGL